MTTKKISEYDQFWLDHQAAQQASGLTAKEYATEQGVSLQAFYQARKKLRRAGLLRPHRDAAKPTKKAPAKPTLSFSKVAAATATPAEGPRFRLELPTGIALDWPGHELPASLITLLERLARPA
jgi:hypothetical protein